MVIQVRLEGGEELARAMRGITDAMRQGVSEAVEETARNIETGVKMRMQQGQKTGRVYKRGGVLHQASAPGQSPAVDTGVLLGSIYSEKETDMMWVAGSRLAYAAYLEFGTSRMAARPAWVPEAREHAGNFKKMIEAVLLREVVR